MLHTCSPTLLQCKNDTLHTHKVLLNSARPHAWLQTERGALYKLASERCVMLVLPLFDKCAPRASLRNTHLGRAPSVGLHGCEQLGSVLQGCAGLQGLIFDVHVHLPSVPPPWHDSISSTRHVQQELDGWSCAVATEVVIECSRLLRGTCIWHTCERMQSGC